MAPHRALIDTLFAEMRGRQKEDDSSVPVKDVDWLYWWAYAPGAEYRTWYRRPVAGGAAEILVDEPAEAAKGPYFRLGALEASPSGPDRKSAGEGKRGSGRVGMGGGR